MADKTSRGRRLVAFALQQGNKENNNAKERTKGKNLIPPRCRRNILTALQLKHNEEEDNENNFRVPVQTEKNNYTVAPTVTPVSTTVSQASGHFGIEAIPPDSSRVSQFTGKLPDYISPLFEENNNSVALPDTPDSPVVNQASSHFVIETIPPDGSKVTQCAGILSDYISPLFEENNNSVALSDTPASPAVNQASSHFLTEAIPPDSSKVIQCAGILSDNLSPLFEENNNSVAPTDTPVLPAVNPTSGIFCGLNSPTFFSTPGSFHSDRSWTSPLSAFDANGSEAWKEEDQMQTVDFYADLFANSPVCTASSTLSSVSLTDKFTPSANAQLFDLTGTPRSCISVDIAVPEDNSPSVKNTDADRPLEEELGDSGNASVNAANRGVIPPTVPEDNPSYLEYADSDGPLEEELSDRAETPVNEADREVNPVTKRKRSGKDRQESKRLKNLGLAYVTSKGMEKSSKSTQHVNCKCKCDTKISDEQRQDIFKSFWESGNTVRQNDFICRTVESKPCMHHRKPKNGEVRMHARNVTYEYSLPIKTNEGADVSISVCKIFYTATLNLTLRRIYWTKKKEANGLSKTDNRGRHQPKHKLTATKLEALKQHINSFPRMASHYCRKKTSREYLHPELKNVSKLYALYCESIEDEPEKDVKIDTYRKVFKSMNLSFHRPKKDYCRICARYELLSSDEEKAKFKADNEMHHKNKEMSRQLKEDHKKKAEVDESFTTYTFDLQSVLYSPCSDVSSFYYTRKFCTYNLTIYDQNSKDGWCFVWHETEGKRGSDEIGSCLYNHLKNLPSNVLHVSLFCDSCGGQNRNRFILAFLLHVIRTLQLLCIEINFLETGHTDMEVDSMHSAIETEKKGTPVYEPNEYVTIIRRARRRQPYFVEQLDHSSFYDLKDLKEKTIAKELKANTSGKTVNWMKVKQLKFLKGEPNKVFYKNAYDEAEYQVLDVSPPRKRGSATSAPPAVVYSLKQKYRAQVPIAALKKKDLVTLCTTNPVIPEANRPFYMNLPVLPPGAKRNTVERLPEPDAEESEDEDEF